MLTDSLQSQPPSIGAATPSDHERSNQLQLLNAQVIQCRRCPRLVQYREEVGRIGRRAYRGQQYWSKPVPGFGDPAARLLILGLAPGAHGSNRTGRMFTGDRSGDFLYSALYEAGFANQPSSSSLSDGLQLRDAYITAPVRCVPPDNWPDPADILACRSYLVSELELLTHLQIVVALGGIALNAYLSVLKDRGLIKSRSAFRFSHGAKFHPSPEGLLILTSYHPSQQNTSTKRLTAQMFRDIFSHARDLLSRTAFSIESASMIKER